MDCSAYQYSLGCHRDKKVIWVKFPKDHLLIEALLKKFPEVKWSASQKCWYLPDNQAIREQISLPLDNVGKNALKLIHPVNMQAFQQFIRHLKLKAYSTNTITVYSREFAQLLYIIQAYPVEKLNTEKLKSYFLYCIEKLGLSENHLNSRINAIKFYFEQVLGKNKLFFDIPRPKKPLALPRVLSQSEVKKYLTVQITLNTY